MRIVVLLLMIFCHLTTFSQEKKFERFLNELNTYAANSYLQTFAQVDSIPNWRDYELKWVHTRGTYGGSPYFGEGEATYITSEKAATKPVFYSSMMSEPEILSVTQIGNKYVIEKLTFQEPQPTSAIHYVFVTRYYVIKD
jgi:hypothetical protein